MTAMDDKATIKVIKECCQDARRGQQETAVSIRNLAWSIDALATMLGERLEEPERKIAPSMRHETETLRKPDNGTTVPIRRELLPILEMACKVCRDLCNPDASTDAGSVLIAQARQVINQLDQENDPIIRPSPLKGQLLATALVGRAEFSFQVPLNIKQGETWNLGLVVETKGNKIVRGCCVSASRQVDGANPIEERNQALEEMHKKSKPTEVSDQQTKSE